MGELIKRLLITGSGIILAGIVLLMLEQKELGSLFIITGLAWEGASLVAWAMERIT